MRSDESPYKSWHGIQEVLNVTIGNTLPNGFYQIPGLSRILCPTSGTSSTNVILNVSVGDISVEQAVHGESRTVCAWKMPYIFVRTLARVSTAEIQFQEYIKETKRPQIPQLPLCSATV